MPAASSRRLVALDLPPGEAFAAALDAAWRRGDAVLPLDPAAPGSSRQAVLDALQPDAGTGDDTALVIATSGSTGAPKGVELSAAALEASARATMARIGTDPGDRWLACLPWHHIGGLQVLLRARLFGTPLVIHDRFDVDRVAAETDVTLTSLVPTQLLRLLDAGIDLGRFRAILLGGAMAPPALLDRARRAGANVVTTYGMSETSGGCVYDGRPLDGAEVRLGADDRILLRGPMLMSRYRHQPELTAETLVGGWLHTQDVGRLAGDGTLSVLGRLDDIVVTGGENVVTTQVAARVAAHPAVADAAVAGVPDPEWGQRLVAVVVARGDAPSLDEIRAWCRETLPGAAAPRQLLAVDAIPRLSSGKPDRLTVQQLAAQASSDGSERSAT